MLALLAGCVLREPYAEPGVPDSALAVVEGYWHYVFLYDEEMHIASVDGKRSSGGRGWPYAYSVSLPPGKHWLQLAILRNSGDVARCAFEWTFEAGHRYELKRLRHDQFLLAHPAQSPFKASITMEVVAPAGRDQLLSVPAVCASGAVCRESPDCAPGYACRVNAGYDFGTCQASGR